MFSGRGTLEAPKQKEAVVNKHRGKIQKIKEMILKNSFLPRRGFRVALRAWGMRFPICGIFVNDNLIQCLDNICLRFGRKQD